MFASKLLCKLVCSWLLSGINPISFQRLLKSVPIPWAKLETELAAELAALPIAFHTDAAALPILSNHEEPLSFEGIGGEEGETFSLLVCVFVATEVSGAGGVDASGIEPKKLSKGLGVLATLGALLQVAFGMLQRKSDNASAIL